MKGLVQQGAKVRIPRLGAQWLHGRMIWCICLAIVHSLRGILKLTIIPEDITSAGVRMENSSEKLPATRDISPTNP